MSSLTRLAYAKINPALTILRRRDDGYHDLITVIQRVSIADELTVSPLAGEVEYSGASLTDDPEDNLCVKAARSFRRRFGDSYGASIHLSKNIPVGAGLGGGSSDAATLLTLMKEIYNLRDCDELLFDAALETGSDVPFFLSQFSATVAEGQGERLTQVPGLNHDLTVLIVWSGIAVSTAWAYGLADNCLTFNEDSVKVTTREIKRWSKSKLSEVGVNDFEAPIFGQYPELEAVCVKMRDSDALGAGLSGSGSALFGLYRKEDSARKMLNELPDGWIGFICNPC